MGQWAGPVPLQLLLLLAAMGSIDCLVLTSDQKVETVNTHNRLRRSVYPQASDMNYLTWNTRLETLAQTAADRCVFEHNYSGDYANLGENLYLGGRTNVSDMVTLFFMENVAYNYQTGACDKPNVFNFVSCGHYQQVVGAYVKEVGCAIAACSAGNLFVCEYNRMAPTPIYTAGKPCSNCYATGFCLDGLCINGTMRDSLVNTYNTTVTCSLVCKNCGTKYEIIFTPSMCMCSCLSGYTGYDCSTKVNPSAPALTCSLCTQQATPCLNGGVENSTTSCSCSCPANFTGPQCQLESGVYTSAIMLQLKSSNTFCSNGKCSAVPSNPLTFVSQTWPTLQSILVSTVNAFCRSASNFASCCGVAPPGGGPTGDYLAVNDMRYVDFSVQLNSTGNLGVAVFAVAQSDNSLCASATGRRRRRAAATTSVVSMSVLNGTLSSANSTISGSLSSCCGFTVDSAGSYKAVADVQFGYSGSSTDGATTAGSGGISTSTTATTAVDGNSTRNSGDRVVSECLNCQLLLCLPALTQLLLLLLSC